MRLAYVVALHEGFHRQLPVDRHAAGQVPLGPQRLCLPRIECGDEGLNALAQPRGAVIKVDEGTTIGDLDAARRKGHVARFDVGLVEQIGLVDVGVGPVEAVAPAVEGTGESRRSVPAVFDQLDTSVATGVVIGPHCRVVHSHDDDRLVQDYVFDEVTGMGDLRQPARHLPDMRPQQFAFHGIELGVVVPPGGNTV